MTLATPIKKHRRAFLRDGSLLLLGAGLAGVPVRLLAEDKQLQTADEFWNSIKAVRESERPEGAEELSNHWWFVRQECREKFYAVMFHPDRDRIIEDYVVRFGKDGPQADMRWILSAQSELIGFWGSEPVSKRSPARYQATIRRLSECVVRRSLKDSKFLERYYRVILWGRDLIGPSGSPSAQATNVRDAANEDNADTYWWKAQKFVFLAHLMDRDDIFKNAEPTNLRPKFRELTGFIKSNRTKFVVDVMRYRLVISKDANPKRNELLPKLPFPPTPFDTWEGVEAPSGESIPGVLELPRRVHDELKRRGEVPESVVE